MIEKSFRKSGFTLLELLIATSIFVVLLTGVYKIYQSVIRTQQIGAWVMMTTTSLRNGLSFVRDEVAAATVPKKMTPYGITELSGPYDSTKKFKTISGISVPTSADFPDITKGVVLSDFSQTKSIIEFYMCKPGRENIPGEDPVPFEIMRGTLKIQDGKIMYERSAHTQVSTPVKKQMICENPLKIRIAMFKVPSTDLSVKCRNILFLAITAKHPKFPNTVVTENIEAPFEVEPLEGGL